MDITRNQINLYPLGKDKDVLLKTFIENEDIVSLLMPNYNPATATQDLDILLKDHIYTTIEIDNTQGGARAYICMDTYIPLVENFSIKEIGIVINVFCENSLIDLSTTDKNKFVKKGYFGNRIDMLIDAIDRCVNGKTGVGIGKIKLKPRNPIGIYKPQNGYYGKSLEYTVTDFNDIN